MTAIGLTPLTLDRLRADVADQIGERAEQIGDDDDLVSLGLDSIGLMRLSARWAKQGAPITFADLIERRTLREWWQLVDRPVAPADIEIAEPDVDESAPFALSTMQHAYWIGRADGQVLGGVGAHFYAEFDGRDVDPDRLDLAVRAVIERHPMLRARFLDDGTQLIAAQPRNTGLAVRDLRAVPVDDIERIMAEVRDEWSHRRLDVAAGEVFAVALTLLPGGATRVHIKIEMLVADAHSFRVLLSDLARIYRRLYLRQDRPLRKLDYTYPRYRAAVAPAVDERAAAYWRDRIADLPGGPGLPLAVAPEDITAPTVTRHHHRCTARQWTVLDGKARAHGVTLSMVFLTAFAEMLAAWSTDQRFLITLPIYDRKPLHPDVADLVGDFTNLLLLEVDARQDMSFVDRVRAVGARFAEDMRHSAYSGVDVLRDLARSRGAVQAPVVFTSALSLGELFDEDVRSCFGAPGWTMSQTPQVWLDCQVTEREGGLFVNWDVVEGLFPAGVVGQMFAAFVNVLDWLADSDWGALPRLIPAEQLAVRAEANGVVGTGPAGLLHERFFARAAEDKDLVALVWDGGELSFGELRDRALELAGVMVERGVRPGDAVGVCLPKGVGQVVGVLAVLAAGGVYVPVGAEIPVARRDVVFARGGVKVVIGAAPEGVVAVSPDECGVALSGCVSIERDAVAYVIFTSGSTGEPKGVEVSHGAAVNTVVDVCGRFGVGVGDRVLAVSALDFDLSVFDIFGLLGSGGAVVLVDENSRRDARAWLDLVRRHRVTIWQTVPTSLDMLLVAAEEDGLGLGALRLALLGGDWVGLDLRDRLVASQHDARLIALGGTTETAIHSSVFEVGDIPDSWRSIPYGRPLVNQVFRVVDGRGRDCPDWVVGELWIGGLGVARGYRNDPVRTEERFVEWGGLRWYRTGDLGRYWSDGTLEFLGRADFQVKVRGYRVELGEIEVVLRACAGVRDAVVVAVGGARRLVAAVVGDGAPALDLVAERLPAYMVPERVEVLDAFPLSANGKIDRKALAAMLERPDADRVYRAPEGAIETMLATLWAELLDVPRIGRDDEFFLLGGDSLLATRLLGRLRAAGLVGGDLRRLFATPALRDYASGLGLADEPVAVESITADPEHRHEPFPPTDVQRAYWFGRTGDFTLGAVGSHWYWEFDGADVDVARLETAWQRLILRHEMLRAVFDDEGMQRIRAEVPGQPIPVVTGGEAELAQLRARLAHRIPDPTRWPLAEIQAVRYGDDRVRIGFSFDYIVLDALSIVIVFAELSALYQDPDAILPPVDVSFRDYVLTARPDAAEVEASQDYWLARLDDLPPGPQLPLAVEPAEIGAPTFVRHETRLSPERWRAVRERARQHGVTPASVLATAFAEVLSAWSARPDLTLNLTLFDRREVHPDINNILGDFTSLLLVAHRPTAGDGWLDLVRRFQEQVWSGMEHNAVSAVWVLRELARRTGAPSVEMPVVFTSALGVGDDLSDMALPFGEQIWGISQTPQVWLDCQVMQRAGGLYVNWDVVEELFPAGVVDAMFDAFTGLLTWLADGDWATLPELMPARQVEVRAGVNGVVGVGPAGLLHDAFFARAVDQPDLVALVWDGGELSFGALRDRALGLAGVLVERGVRAGDAVGVCLPKGVGQVVAVLGVLAAGGVYVPVGVDVPVVRRDGVFARAGARVVVGAAPEGVVSVSPDDRGVALSECVRVSDGAVAYVIFTSGSTGEPKGVEVSHGAAVNTVVDVCGRFGVGVGDRVLAVSALDFDLSVFDIFGLLGAGGSVVLVDESIRRDARAWVELVRRHRVTVWNTVPALLDMLLVATSNPDDLASLRVALVSGDWVGLDLRDRLVSVRPGARLIALGGATEAAIWSNFHEVDIVPDWWRSIPYGRPLVNQVFRVVDGRGRDCPDWVVGELWIGGLGVARGYRNDPVRTEERFVEWGGLRWYRTGDLGRYWSDGTLEFLGRADFQVKVRGYRVELGEIEVVLRACAGIRDAVVVAIGGARRLVAAVVGDGIDIDAAVAYVTERLPVYMVPERVEVLAEFPLSANGKVSRDRIAELLSEVDSGAAGAQPRDGLEAEIGAIWSRLLGTPVADRSQSFFALGGDSILATRMVREVWDRYGVDIPLRELLGRPTVVAFADAVAARRNDIEADDEVGEL